MNKGCGDRIGPERAMPRRRTLADRLRRGFFIVAAAAALAMSAGNFAEAATFRQGVAAFNRENYMLASRIFIPLAEHGFPAAQAYLGFMFETGRGVRCAPHCRTRTCIPRGDIDNN